MNRYTITVTSDGRSDPDAVIGYDLPLRTFFLQAFPDESGDDLGLWLGTSDREYESVETLHAAARSRGFDFMPLPEDVALLLADDFAKDAARHRLTVRSRRFYVICKRSSPKERPVPDEHPARAFFLSACSLPSNVIPSADVLAAAPRCRRNRRDKREPSIWFP